MKMYPLKRSKNIDSYIMNKNNMMFSNCTIRFSNKEMEFINKSEFWTSNLDEIKEVIYHKVINTNNIEDSISDIKEYIKECKMYFKYF